MSRNNPNKKPNFKYKTPKTGERYKFPESEEEDKELKNMYESKKIWGHESYRTILPNKNKEEKDIEVFHIYVARFTRLFDNAFYDLVDLKTDKVILVHTYPFWLEYKMAYLKGRKFFKENYKVHPDTLYGQLGLLYERNLHRLYYHENFESNFDNGWSYWERFSPLIFEMKTFSKYGYYAGIISALNEFKRLYPSIFKNFDKCSNNETHVLSDTKQTIPEIENLKRSQAENKFLKSMPLHVPIDHFSVLMEKKFKTDKVYLSETDFIKFIKAAFLGQTLQNKIKMNLQPGSKGIVIGLFHEFYGIGKQYEKSSHVREKYIKLLTDFFEGWNFDLVKRNFR